MTDVPCPACGHLVFSHGYGSYDICPVCDWEDDGVQLANPCSAGGANHASLAEWQRRSPKQASDEVPQWPRDPAWRPLTGEEIAEHERRRDRDGPWNTREVVDPADAYWNRPEA